MDEDSTRQSVLFSELAGKPVVAKFDQDHASSDGGAVLLQACDRRLGLTDALIGGIDDRRQSGKIRHAIGDLVRQRLYAIAYGYPDGNDAGRLGADPIQKLLCGRDPVRGENLASQPTLSRFENAFDRADLYRMSVALADAVIERHRQRLKRKAKRITIDLDPTDDPTMPPAPGITAGASSSKLRSSVIPGASPRTTRASWSPTLSTRPGICTKRSTAPAGTSRTGSKSCIVAWKSTAPVAAASLPISCAGC